jgi:hypothetical protein
MGSNQNWITWVAEYYRLAKSYPHERSVVNKDLIVPGLILDSENANDYGRFTTFPGKPQLMEAVHRIKESQDGINDPLLILWVSNQLIELRISILEDCPHDSSSIFDWEVDIASVESELKSLLGASLSLRFLHRRTCASNNTNHNPEVEAWQETRRMNIKRNMRSKHDSVVSEKARLRELANLNSAKKKLLDQHKLEKQAEVRAERVLRQAQLADERKSRMDSYKTSGTKARIEQREKAYLSRRHPKAACRSGLGCLSSLDSSSCPIEEPSMSRVDFLWRRICTELRD